MTTSLLSVPLSQAERQAVRTQLLRVLASPRFQSSKRCATLLRHVVDAALEGHREEIKERVLGVEVFERDLNYDTNLDPVVRVAAGEVRKRLAQYYYDQAHQREIRIELPLGSYVPTFHIPEAEIVADVATTTSGQAAVLEMDLGKKDQEREVRFDSAPVVTKGKSSLRKPFLVAVCCLAVAAVGIVAAVKAGKPASGFDDFWRPMVGTQTAVLLCMGQMKATHVELDPKASRSRFDSPYALGANGVYPKEIPIVVLGDAMVMADLAGMLKASARPYLIRGEASTTFQDLQRGPFVLIGAYDNDWTIRLTDSMRFHFELDPETKAWWIADRQKPGEKIGSVDHMLPYSSMQTDQAIVAKFFDPTTTQSAVVLAGITPHGTHAAGEFVTNPTYLNEFAKQAPRDWQRKNMELIIETNIIDGEDGPPRVIASQLW